MTGARSVATGGTRLQSRTAHHSVSSSTTGAPDLAEKSADVQSRGTAKVVLATATATATTSITASRGRSGVQRAARKRWFLHEPNCSGGFLSLSSVRACLALSSFPSDRNLACGTVASFRRQPCRGDRRPARSLAEARIRARGVCYTVRVPRVRARLPERDPACNVKAMRRARPHRSVHGVRWRHCRG
jgi:hypothetical protein